MGLILPYFPSKQAFNIYHNKIELDFQGGAYFLSASRTDQFSSFTTIG